MRGVDDRNILDEFCIEFCKIVEKHCRYIIVSGFVAISSGRTRATEDIDMIIERIPSEKFKTLHDELIHNGFVCMQTDDVKEAFEYLESNTALRYTYKNQPLPEMEIKFAKDALDEYQIKTRKKLPLTSLDIWFSSIEMNIAFKEELLKSPKDMQDAEHLRIVYETDEREIENVKRKIRESRL